MRRLLVRIWRLINRLFYGHKYVYIGRQVAFNKYTEFSPFCKIHKGASVNDAKIGAYSYIGEDSKLDNCIIGKYCSIASDVRILSATHPTRAFVSTSPVLHSNEKQCGVSFVSQNLFDQHLLVNSRALIIGNDVWIGARVLFIGGHTIGDGAVVAAGAVVSKDVPPYAIVAGNPARIIRYRFSEEDIDFLKKDKWWDKPESWIRENAIAFSDISYYKELVKS